MFARDPTQIPAHGRKKGKALPLKSNRGIPRAKRHTLHFSQSPPAALGVTPLPSSAPPLTLPVRHSFGVIISSSLPIVFERQGFKRNSIFVNGILCRPQSRPFQHSTTRWREYPRTLPALLQVASYRDAAYAAADTEQALRKADANSTSRRATMFASLPWAFTMKQKAGFLRASVRIWSCRPLQPRCLSLEIFGWSS